MFEMTPSSIGIMAAVFVGICVFFAVMIRRELK